jgi:hypothetical protein
MSKSNATKIAAAPPPSRSLRSAARRTARPAGKQGLTVDQK